MKRILIILCLTILALTACASPADSVCMGGSSYKGGAGLLNYGTTELFGKPVISGNDGQNYLVSAGTLKVTGEGLEEGAQVWVSADFTDLSKALGTVTGAEDGAYLFSDNTDYQVTVDADNKAYLTAVSAG